MSQKMKRIEIETKRAHCPINNISFMIAVPMREYELRVFESLPMNALVRLSFEIPVVEPKREITPSELKDLAREFAQNPETSVYKNGGFYDHLMCKLFPDWEG